MDYLAIYTGRQQLPIDSVLSFFRLILPHILRRDGNREKAKKNRKAPRTFGI